MSNGANILALGVTYKRGVGEMREPPALEISKRLADRTASIAYADPRLRAVLVDGVSLKAIDPTSEAIGAADCVLILTDHPEFDYRRIVQHASLVVDSRNATWGRDAPEGRSSRCSVRPSFADRTHTSHDPEAYCDAGSPGTKFPDR